MSLLTAGQEAPGKSSRDTAVTTARALAACASTRASSQRFFGASDRRFLPVFKGLILPKLGWSSAEMAAGGALAAISELYRNNIYSPHYVRKSHLR